MNIIDSYDNLKYIEGDIFTNDEFTTFYILTSIDEGRYKRWAAINLETGNSRCGFQKEINDAVDELRFYGRDVHIKVIRNN